MNVVAGGKKAAANHHLPATLVSFLAMIFGSHGMKTSTLTRSRTEAVQLNLNSNPARFVTLSSLTLMLKLSPIVKFAISLGST